MFGVLEDLETAVDKVAASEQPVDIARLRRLVDRLEHTWLERVRAADVRGDWDAEGFVSPASWLRHRCRMDHGAASGTLKLARTLEQLPATSDSFARGAISRSHAQVIARATTPERASAIAAVEPALVDAAEQVTPRELRNLVQYLTDALDGDGGADGANARHDRRNLYLSSTLHGMLKLDGQLDGDRGELVASTLATMMEI